jgi:5-methylcytosine-specific restriction endonuclease McrA
VVYSFQEVAIRECIMKTDDDMKPCGRCGEWKPLSAFSPGIKTPNYTQPYSYCKKCNSERMRLYIQAHPEKRAGMAEYQRAYRARHKGDKPTCRKHPPSERNKMTTRLRFAILERDHFACVLCGRGVADGAKLHVDHILPICKDGKSTPDNLRTLCLECNYGRG